MKVTKKILAEYLDNQRIAYDEIKQIGSKQLFIVNKGLTQYLFSYYTVIASREIGQVWVVTTKKYSVTTSRQLRQYLNNKQFIYGTHRELIK